MPLDKEHLRTTLAALLPPGAISKLNYCDGHASIRVAGKGLAAAQRNALTQQLVAATRAAVESAGDTFHEAHIDFADEMAPPPLHSSTPPPSGHRPIPVPPRAPAAPGAPLLPDVKHIIAVGAGKGGVGKSTIAVNLAVGLARKGFAVGLMDADIYGPSLPTMLGLSGLNVQVRGSTLEPLLVHGIKAMTIGKLVDPEKPLIWRGPMAHGAFKQLVEQTGWGELDYLIIDLPPGTGDVALTMAQMLKLTGAVVVCTPQKVAQDDAVRAARMFQQLNIAVLGVVENMSWFIGDDGKEYDIFGKGGAQLMAQRLGVPFLGAVPINVALRQNSDSGDPIANFTDTSPRNKPLAQALETLITNIENQAALAAIRTGLTSPTLSIT